jgi:hypothetical protein
MEPGCLDLIFVVFKKSVRADRGNLPAKMLRVKKNIRDCAIFSIQKNAGIFRTLFTLTIQAGVRGDFELIAVVLNPSGRPIPMKGRHSNSLSDNRDGDRQNPRSAQL